MFDESRSHALVRREARKGGVQLSQRGAVLVFPSREQRFVILFQPERKSAFTRDRPKAVGRVDFFDAVNRRHFESGLTGLDVKLKRSGAHNCVIGYALRRLEITLQIGILHELDVAEITKSLAAD